MSFVRIALALSAAGFLAWCFIMSALFGAPVFSEEAELLFDASLLVIGPSIVLANIAIFVWRGHERGIQP